MVVVSNKGTLNTSNCLHECLWFCFSRLLQKELDNVKKHWNSHYIRRSTGKPEVLCYRPESVGAEDFLQPVTSMQVEDMSQHCQDTNDGQEDDSYQEYFKRLCANEHPNVCKNIL